MNKIITVIKCETKGELLAVLSKIELETDAKWNNGFNPTEYYPETTIYPIHLLIYFEVEKIHITYSIDTIYNIRIQHKEDIMYELDAKDYLSSKNEKTLSVNDPVKHPSHYTQGKVECIDAMIEVYGIEAVKNFCLCNAFKYHWRHEQKNGQEDIAKATWYMDKYRELMNSEG